MIPAAVRKPFGDLSIKRKLILIIMATSTVALLLVSASFVAYELFTFRKGMTRDLSTLAEIIGSQSTAALTYDDKATAEEILSAVKAKKQIVAAALYKDTLLFAHFPPERPAEGLVPARAGEPEAVFEQDHLILFHRIMLQGETIGTIYLKSDLKEMRDRLQRYGGIIILFALASSTVAFLLSSRLQRIITGPVSHLVSTARTVSQGKNYSVRAEKGGQDELGLLIESFNEMLDQIQNRDAALQRAHDELERRVEKRTLALQQEIAERKQAEKAIQQQLARISLLNHITRAIFDRKDLHAILHEVLQQLENHLPVPFGCVYLFDPQTKVLDVAAVRLKGRALDTTHNLPRVTTADLERTNLRPCLHGSTVYLPETSRVQAPVCDELAALHLESAAVLPLMVDGNLFGVLFVARPETDSISSGECEFLRMLTEQVALAAHQAKLYTELQGAYEELRKTQETVMQDERLRALGQLASGIAHDINNALTPVAGFSELMLYTEDGLTEGGRKNLEHILTAARDVAHIVSRLREFYRKREDNQPLLPVRVNALAKQVIEMTRPRWRDIPQEQGVVVKVETDLDNSLPVTVGIESELREALTNLIINAVDALPKGGTILVRTFSTSWEHSEDGVQEPSHIILEVTDNGIGMDEETRKSCLQPFFSTKGMRGTGMGLSMVYGVMERHDGRIDIDSTPGQGTTMRLVLPVRKPTAVVADSDTQQELPVAPLRILFVDDEPLLREMMRGILTTDGHDVTVADGGKAGLKTFREALQRGDTFDVVITDLGMPYLDGRQLAVLLKEESPATPVIMLTGWGSLMKADTDLPVQVDCMLSKPPKIRDIRAALRKATQRRVVKVGEPAPLDR